MTVLEQFEKAVHGPWRTTGLDVQYRVERGEDCVRVYFQYTRSLLDWIIDLMAWPVLRGIERGEYYAHSGYTKAWESAANDVLTDIVIARGVDACDRLEIYGHSYGGAIALLLHQTVRRYWAMSSVQTFVFGAPRVFWGEITERMRYFMEGVTAYRMDGDAVTHFPPRFLGYKDAGNVVKIGPKRRFLSFNAHKPSEYRKNLEGYILGVYQSTGRS